LINWLAEGARGLSPAYFALVMATGIVSIASDRAGLRAIAAVLLWLGGKADIQTTLSLVRLSWLRGFPIAEFRDVRLQPPQHQIAARQS